MRVKTVRYFIGFLCSTFLIALTLSCHNLSQPIKEKHVVQSKDSVQKIKTIIDNIRLKYTTGIRSILEDSKGNSWFGSHQEGVCLLQNGELQYFTKENGLSDNQVRNIYEDEQGLIWFECGTGLSSYDGNKITRQTRRNYEAKEEWKLSKNSLWFKGDETFGYNKLEEKPGVYEYDGQQISYHTFPVKPGSGQEFAFTYSVSTPFVKSRNGTVWFGAYGAAIGYNGSDFKIIDNKYLGLNSETGLLHIRSILEDSKGNLWIGNNGKVGVFKYDGENVINFTAEQKLKKEDTQGNSLERVFSMGEDTEGNIWFGTVESGVWRYDGHSMKNFTKEDGIDSKQIWTIYKSNQGELWFGGANPSGVYRFNGSSFERKF